MVTAVGLVVACSRAEVAGPFSRCLIPMFFRHISLSCGTALPFQYLGEITHYLYALARLAGIGRGCQTLAMSSLAGDFWGLAGLMSCLASTVLGTAEVNLQLTTRDRGLYI